MSFSTETDDMIKAAKEIYDIAGVRIDISSYEVLDFPEFADLRVGKCTAATITAAQRKLFTNRNYAGPKDPVAYFINSTIPASDGCAAYAPGAPGMVIVKKASQWALAHELGHVLGLSHVDDNRSLMTSNGTDKITCRPPKLSRLDIYLINQSCYVNSL
jgi:hypothetical protein